jgi:hypothetical protein
MAMSADDIRLAFAALARQLEAVEQRGEIVVIGGAALVLLFDARQSTKDVDAYFLKPDAAALRAAAAHIAEQMNLPSDWLNDAAKGYLHGLEIGETLYETNSLTVYAASATQLLALKLAAWRDAVDRADAKLLLEHLRGSRREIWSAVERFVPEHELDKASYAFDDLWEAVHGPS